MNRDRARELLPIIQAFADGKTVQILMGNSGGNIGGEFEDVGNPEFKSGCIFRIKPEPEVIYVNKMYNGTKFYNSNEQMAKTAIKGMVSQYEYIAKKFIAADE